MTTRRGAGQRRHDVARLGDLFAGRSLEAVLKRARHRLATGDFDEATRVVLIGLERYPEAETLRELHLTIRRVQARSGMQELKRKIAHEHDPLAYEQLITLYQEVDMFDEARRTAHEYVEAHADRDTPHLILGETYLELFFEELKARYAHTAHDHLLRAARLNPDALKPRLLLAELYYCVGANRALSVVGRALERVDPDDDVILPILQTIVAVADPDANESMDGLFSQIEADGQLARDMTTWPLRNRRNREAQIREERTHKAVAKLVRDRVADEVLVLRRNGVPVVLASVDGAEDSGLSRRPVHVATEDEIDDAGLTDVVRTVAHTISQQAREFDLGAFRRCVIEGPFGLVVVGRVSNVILGAHRRRVGEPHRLWERLSVSIDGVSQGGSTP
jgi:hypothetical protein